MQQIKIGEIIVKDLFEEIQPKVEPTRSFDDEARLFASLVTNNIKRKLDEVKSPRDLLTLLAVEFENGVAASLSTHPLEKINEELDEFLKAVRTDIIRQIEKARRFFSS